MAIAIMSCRKLIGRCSGGGCHRAYNNSTAAFERYADNKEELASFFYCSGCEDNIIEDKEWKEKIADLKKKDVKTIHISRCVKSKCNDYDKYEETFKKEGFEVVHGSH